MAHEIFGERYLNHREPAWHGLGLTITDGRKLGACDAFKLMGEYDIRMEPLYMANGAAVERQAIVRNATSKGEAEAVLGTVGMEYRPIGPLATCLAYDEAVGQPVETIGALRDGAVLFITVKLPNWSVAGDDIEDYLLVVNPMDGLEAAQIVRSPVRVVCANTLRLSRDLGAVQYKVRHNENAHTQLLEWLRQVYASAVDKSKVIQEACEILTTVKVSMSEATPIIRDIYPDPRVPRNTAPSEVMKKRHEHREYLAEYAAVAREQVALLFGGKGKGMDTPAAKGTAWGLYQGVIEYEDYKWSKNAMQAQESALFGARADIKEAAFDRCMALVNRG